MLEHAFERLGLHRVGLSVFSFNVRAIRGVPEGGLRGWRAGCARRSSATAATGTRSIMGALRSEWLRRHPGYVRPARPEDEESVDDGRERIAAGTRTS